MRGRQGGAGGPPLFYRSRCAQLRHSPAGEANSLNIPPRAVCRVTISRPQRPQI